MSESVKFLKACLAQSPAAVARLLGMLELVPP